MKVVEGLQQNSLAWLQARAGVVTASEFGNFLTDGCVPRRGDMVKNYVSKKLAEWWIGGPLPGFNTIDMEFGHIRESQAIPAFELTTGLTVSRVAFITNDDGTVGCSPDGLIDDNAGLECKCPSAHQHVRWLMSGDGHLDYLPQIYGGMYVTGRTKWYFCSYCPRFPIIITKVEMDEEIWEHVEEGVENVLELINVHKARLIELNGGPPVRPEPYRDPDWMRDPEVVP